MLIASASSGGVLTLTHPIGVRAVVIVAVVAWLGDLDILIVLVLVPAGSRKSLCLGLGEGDIGVGGCTIVLAIIITVDILSTSWRRVLLSTLIDFVGRAAVKSVKRRLAA